MIKLITKGTSFTEVYMAIIIKGMETNTQEKFEWIHNFNVRNLVSSTPNDDLYIFMNYSDRDIEGIRSNVSAHKNSIVASDYMSEYSDIKVVKTTSDGSSIIDSILSSMPLGISVNISSASFDIIDAVKRYLVYNISDLKPLMAYAMYQFHKEFLFDKYINFINNGYTDNNGNKYALIIENSASLYMQMKEAIDTVYKTHSRIFDFMGIKMSILLVTDNSFINEKAHKLLTLGVNCAILVVLDNNNSRVSIRTDGSIDAVDVAKLFDENAKGKSKVSTVFVHFTTFDYETLINLIVNYKK
ncbi:hypothetical protein RND61_15340 [Streptomyces sp. TRM76323]|uniref:Uncharacterized protein n=1 Tax=Streptomyces tamarix TaxID=3078565 RepID=A0ABU3QLZ0_9ACTN|nr:hypothetical protein [Streptomyces tamarix]MDT9683422.1 hypothetical protein [Streptomyces tamarix]